MSHTKSSKRRLGVSLNNHNICNHIKGPYFYIDIDIEKKIANLYCVCLKCNTYLIHCKTINDKFF